MELKKIASFEVDHNKLLRGIYISRIDGDVVTYDIRMKVPNNNDYLPNPTMHTIEHIVATYVRSSEHKDSIIYFGPMGCRTGFYLLVRDKVTHREVIELLNSAFLFLKDFEGVIPGYSAKECGNYLEHDLENAKKEAQEFLKVIENYCENNLFYVK